MKLAISQLAIKDFPFPQSLELLRAFPLQGIEIAPKLLWEDPGASSQEERLIAQQLFIDHGLKIVGLQSLLYGCPDLQVFGFAEQRQKCLEHLKAMMKLCRDMEGSLLIFGAPKNRKRGDLPAQEAQDIALDFFKEIGRAAEETGVIFCLEPVAAHYGCDFINTVKEAADLVRKVNLPHFRLQADTGSMFLNSEPFREVFREYGDMIEHVHINDPDFSPPGAKGCDHKNVASVLKEIGYDRWLSLEFMCRSTLREDLQYALHCYAHEE